MPPDNLVGFDFIGMLQIWANVRPKRRAHWTIHRYGKGAVRAELTWVDRNGGLCALTKDAPSAEKATSLVLKEFNVCNKFGDHN